MLPVGVAAELAVLEADVFGMMRELMSCQMETLELLELDHQLHEELLAESSQVGLAAAWPGEADADAEA